MSASFDWHGHKEDDDLSHSNVRVNHDSRPYGWIHFGTHEGADSIVTLFLHGELGIYEDDEAKRRFAKRLRKYADSFRATAADLYEQANRLDNVVMTDAEGAPLAFIRAPE